MLSRHRGVLALAAYLADLAVHQTAQLRGQETWVDVTQWLLMPLLALVLWLAPVPKGDLTRWVLVAIGCSWLGDFLPHFLSGDAAFLVMVGAFAAAQATYARAFWPMRKDSVTGSAWPVAYAAAAACLVLVCAPGAGSLLGAVVAYALVITVMAVLATGVNRLAWLGGVVFMCSDALIALEAFVPRWDLPGQSFWVMLTYGAAQLLLVLGVLARSVRRGAADTALTAVER
jgi:uncharacterized membrane protein YhhN